MYHFSSRFYETTRPREVKEFSQRYKWENRKDVREERDSPWNPNKSDRPMGTNERKAIDIVWWLVDKDIFLLLHKNITAAQIKSVVDMMGKNLHNVNFNKTKQTRVTYTTNPPPAKEKLNNIFVCFNVNTHKGRVILKNTSEAREMVMPKQAPITMSCLLATAS